MANQNDNEFSKKVIEFYINKEAKQPRTIDFMKEYRQKGGGYISFAKMFICNNDKSIETLERLKEAYEHGEESKQFKNYLDLRKREQTNELSQLESLKGLDRDFIFDIKFNKDEGEPNQKWHLFVSYFAQHELESKREEKENKPNINMLRCPELLLWLAEAAGIEQEKVEEVADKAKNIIDKGPGGRSRGKAAAEIKRIIPWERIKKIPCNK